MMKIVLPVLFVVLVSGCVTTTASDAPHPKSQTHHVKAGKLTKQKQKGTIVVKAPGATKLVKCKLPAQPKPLDRPLPMDSLKTLVDKLTIKLQEWVQYGDRVEEACD